MRTIILILCFLGSLFFMRCVDANIDKFITDKNTREVVDAGYEDISKWMVSNQEDWNNIINYAWMVVGTVYKWGGDSWTDGIDCSHFTHRMWNDVTGLYPEYMATERLQKIKKTKYGLKPIYFKNARPGDLLVYGTDNIFTGWKGHVVLLVSKKDKVVVGSHGGIGVQLIKFSGFPDYYRNRIFKLRKVLRAVR